MRQATAARVGSRTGSEGGRERTASFVPDVAARLVRARTADAAVRLAVASLHRRLGLPTAGWLVADDGLDGRLVASAGLPPAAAEALRRLRPFGARGDRRPERAAAAFAAASRADGVEVIDRERVRLVVGGVTDRVRGSVAWLASFLDDVLDRLDVVGRAERRDRELDMALALTAHELRGPMLAAKTQIDAMLFRHDWPREHRDLLRRSRGDLEDLAGLVDAVLRWAVTGDPPPRHRIDLVRLVRDIVESLDDADGARIEVRSPDRVLVDAAPVHLKIAIVNLLRNALAFSPPTSEVVVHVAREGGAACLRVEDHGPGVPTADAASIFDPFSRGRASHASRQGWGLGLFIARRVVEAHGGRLALERTPRARGAVFRIDLPAPDEPNRAGEAPAERSSARLGRRRRP